MTDAVESMIDCVTSIFDEAIRTRKMEIRGQIFMAVELCNECEGAGKRMESGRKIWCRRCGGYGWELE